MKRYDQIAGQNIGRLEIHKNLWGRGFESVHSAKNKLKSLKMINFQAFLIKK